MFGGKAGGATYLRYIASHSRGFSFSRIIDQMTTFRPPTSVYFYALRKWANGWMNGRPGTVAIGAYFFKADDAKTFYDQLFNVLQGARAVSRYGYVECSTDKPDMNDMLRREGTAGKDECEGELGGPITLGTLLTMALQLNRPELKFSVGSVDLGARLTGKARERINADIRDSALFPKITSLVLVLNKGRGTLEFRACPVPPQMKGRITIGQDACPSLSLELSDSRNSLHVTAPNWINSTQMEALMEDSREVMEEGPGHYSARVV